MRSSSLCPITDLLNYSPLQLAAPGAQGCAFVRGHGGATHQASLAERSDALEDLGAGMVVTGAAQRNGTNNTCKVLYHVLRVFVQLPVVAVYRAVAGVRLTKSVQVGLMTEQSRAQQADRNGVVTHCFLAAISSGGRYTPAVVALVGGFALESPPTA
jgi:hypothetical protein